MHGCSVYVWYDQWCKMLNWKQTGKYKIKFSEDMTWQWIEPKKYQDKMQVARSQDKWKSPRYTVSGGICKFMEQFMSDKVHNS